MDETGSEFCPGVGPSVSGFEPATTVSAGYNSQGFNQTIRVLV
jgi:hypothetical protein